MDCTFMTEEGKFNYRVGAVITDGSRVLVTTEPDAEFYWVTGGRVHIGETAGAAVLREIREELGVTAEIDRLYSISEKFFECAGVRYHELEFLFLIKPFNLSLIDYEAVHCDSPKIQLVWLDISKKPDKPVYPLHLFDAVKDSSGDLRFITVDEMH